MLYALHVGSSTVDSTWSVESTVSDSQKGEYTVKYAEHTGSNPAQMGGVVCAWYVKRDSQCNEHINAHNAMTLTAKIQRQGCMSWSHSLLNAKGNFLTLNLKILIRKSVHSSSTYLWSDKLLAGGKIFGNRSYTVAQQRESKSRFDQPKH